MASTTIGATSPDWTMSWTIPTFLLPVPITMRTVTLACTVLQFLFVSAQDEVIVPFGATWKYLDNGSNQGTAWSSTAYNDAAWASGPAQLGYGEGDEATVIGYGPNPSSKYRTSYFRTTLSVPNATTFGGFRVRFIRDDGLIMYVNGTEVLRNNMNQGAQSYTAFSYSGISGSDESRVYEHLIPAGPFVNGSNTIAVEVHQDDPASSDVSFDMEITAMDGTPGVYSEPYLQQASPTSIKVLWKTDSPCLSKVRYGLQPNLLDMEVTGGAPVLDHEVQVNGLTPGTNYYYTVGTPTADLTPAGDPSYSFRTLPAPTIASPVRIWVTGDQGTGFAEQLAVRDAYLAYAGANGAADAWLTLGDNAYLQGREAEFQVNIFNGVYGAILRNTCLWPVPGNHDYYSGASAATQTGTYYSLFAPPTSGQCGGVPSGTESYYSFDIGNVHIVCLDSYGVSRSAAGAMALWLQQDLVQAELLSDWIIVAFHHPPYTKGSHDSDNISDSGGIMFDMRQTFLPILEAHGVDLVLCGHSHVYERSFLIDGHHGTSSTWNASTMRKDGTSGNANTTGAYQKPGDLEPHAGTVYAVCGVSGKRASGASLNHPAMYMSTQGHWGSLLLDVHGDSLRMRFMNSTGAMVDQVDIHKTTGTLRVQARTLLDGPYDPGTGLMADQLRSAGLIPLTHPHTGLFTPVGPSPEAVLPSVLATSGPDAIVDWAFMQLRSAIDPTTVVAACSVLIQRDGDLVDVDGSSPVEFTAPMDRYHIAVLHRNHLGIMTAAPVLLDHGVKAVDLSLPSTAVWGVGARKDLGTVQTMWSGDGRKDGQLRYIGSQNDRDAILVRIGGLVPTQVVPGYLPEDHNLDGSVRYVGAQNDRDPILQNIGGTLPTAVRAQQVP